MNESWGEEWMDHPVTQWLMRNAKNIGYFFLILALLLFIAYRFSAYRYSQTEKEYAQASVWLNELDHPEKREQALQHIQTLLLQNTNLEPVYDGIVAQDLITQNVLAQAEPFISRSFKRVYGIMPQSYLEYSQTSLLIADQKYEAALKNAYELQKRLLEEFKSNSHAFYGGTLYAFNTIRIAFLEKSLNHPIQEKVAWTELQDLAKGTHIISVPRQEMQRIMTHFDDQNASLNEYLKGLL